MLRRETLGTYDSILALHLAKMMRASTDEHVLISRDDIHEIFAGVVNEVDRNEVAFATASTRRSIGLMRWASSTRATTMKTVSP